jgi:ABC-type metal ion transport system substrate-binding protein
MSRIKGISRTKYINRLVKKDKEENADIMKEIQEKLDNEELGRK